MASHTFVFFSSWISSSPNWIFAMWPYFANYIIINRLFRAASKQKNEWNAHGSHRKHKLSTINHTDIKYHHLKCTMWSGKKYYGIASNISDSEKNAITLYETFCTQKSVCCCIFCTKVSAVRSTELNLLKIKYTRLDV